MDRQRSQRYNKRGAPPGKATPQYISQMELGRDPDISRCSPSVQYFGAGMSKPLDLVILDDAVRHLRDTLKRNREIVPPSLAGMICGLVSYWGRRRLGGSEMIYPGVERMASWGPCKTRQAKSNLSMLRNWGVLEPVAYPHGGRRSTRYIVHVEALVPVLVDLGLNPSVELVEKLRNRAVNRAVTDAENRALTAHGIQRVIEGVSSPSARPSQGVSAQAQVIPFPGQKSNREAS